MTKTMTVIISALVAIFTIGYLLQIDDDLSPESNALLDAIDWQTPSDSYIYLLGISAPLDAMPLQVGAEILTEIRHTEKAYSDTLSFDELPSSIERDRLDLPKSDIFCGAREPDCIESLFANIRTFSPSPTTQALKQRYLTFMTMRNYRTLTEPNIFEPFASYEYLVKGNRLVSLGAIEKANAGNINTAINELYQLIELEKRHLAETDNLIGRMIAYVLLNETIDILSILVRHHAVVAKRIELLNSKQLSLAKPIQREFALVKSALVNINLTDDYSNWPNWMLRLVFKPNITINAAVPIYENAVVISELPIADFAAHSPIIKLERSWVRNIVGTVLNKVASTDFIPYVARGFDINAKLLLFNEINSDENPAQNLSDIELNKIANPYYPLTSHAALSEDKRSVCFDGPDEDKRLFRCLKISYSEVK